MSTKETKLKQFIEKHGYTQADVIRLYYSVSGDMIGRDRMSHYVNGKVEPQAKVALNMAKALSTTVEEIFGDII